MDWLFKNKIAPLEIPKIAGDLNPNCDLDELFLQQENGGLSEVEFKRIWDISADLFTRSRIYALLDAPRGDFDANIANTRRDLRNFGEDVMEEDVLNSLNYSQGDGSSFAYDLCLEYLAKSKLKFTNTINTKENSLNIQSSGRKRNPKKIRPGRRPLVVRLPSLTKQVKFLRRQNLGKSQLKENDFTSSISSSTEDVTISLSSSIGDYETEEKACTFKNRHNKLKGKRKWKVRYENYYNSRRQNLVQLERRSKKSKRRKSGNVVHLWPVNCCIEKPQFKKNAHARTILEFSVKTLFLFICVTILLDALQFNENFEDFTFESIL